MVLSKDDLPRLIKLQEQDRALDQLKAAIDKIPADIQDLRAALEARRSHIAEIKGKAVRLHLTKKEKEIELGQKEGAVRKHGQELNAVKTNEAYRALQTEIDTAKAEAGDLETGILLLMDEIDLMAKEEKTEAARLREAEGKAQQEIQTLEAQASQLAIRKESERAKREDLAGAVSPEAVALYESIRRSKQGIALSPVQDNTCGACRMTLLPQSLVELARATAPVRCESCQRILFLQQSPARQPA